MYVVLAKEKPGIETRGLNLAAVRPTAVQLTKPQFLSRYMS
jgi:hypothetical protein